MQLEYDLTVGALYIRLSGREIARTREVDYNTNVDLDDNGVIVGIEILDIDLPWPLEVVIRDFALPNGQLEHLLSYFPLAAPVVSVGSPPPSLVAA